MPRRNPKRMTMKEQRKPRDGVIPQPRKMTRPASNHPRCPVTNKLSFESFGAADRALKRIILDSPSFAYRCYQCPYEECRQWHHTSQPRRDT